jgi:predicted nucleic acid-binding protein
MTAFDTDVLTEILLGNAAFEARAATIPIHQQAVPIVVIEEILRGRLNIIRQAEAGKASISIECAYELFQELFMASMTTPRNDENGLRPRMKSAH